MRALLAAASTFLLIACLAGCGDEESEPAATATQAPAESTTALTTPKPAGGDAGSGGSPPRDADRPDEPEPEPAADPRDDEDAKQAALLAAQRAYRAYIAAINDRDGERLCALLPPGAERTLKPAKGGEDCAAALGASIGYEDPRGFPVWEETILSGIESASIGRDLDSARLTGAIVTEFADRTEPSIESDIAYLERVGGSWRLAKPTGALYRAIGQPEIPPSVISPP